MAKTPDQSAESVDVKALHEHELKVRDLHQKGWSEGTKFAVEFSRLIITNLVWINAAGLGSLPVIAKFVGVDGGGWTEKRHILIYPGAAFAFGLFTALLCAFATYLNFNSIARTFLAGSRMEISSIRAQYPAYGSDRAFKEMVDGELKEAPSDFRSANWWVEVYYVTGIVLGFVSFISFAAACYLLVTIEAA